MPPRFPASPVLLPAQLAGAAANAVVGDDNSESRKKFLAKYPDIAPYLAIVARSAADQKIDPYFQAAVLAQENGGFVRWSTNAVSSAGAGGIAQFMPGTWSGSWNPYKNKDRNDPQYAIPAQSVYLRNLLRTYHNDMARAAAVYNAGPAGTPQAGYVEGVRRYMHEIRTAKVFGGDSSNWLKDAANTVIHAGEEVVDAATGGIKAPIKLAQIFLDPKKAGELVANIWAVTLRFAGKAIWKYVLAPPFHWTQRATIYYYENVMGSKDSENTGFYYNVAMPTTVAFWAIGYGILWRRADNMSVPAKPEDTAIGQLVGSATSLIAKRKVSAPNKVAEATPEKPQPVKSGLSVNKVRSLSATRRRQVTVSTGRKENGRGNRNSEASDSETGSQAETDSLSEAA